MMISIGNSILLSMKSETSLLVEGRAVPVVVRRYHRARGYRLRYDAAKERLLLSMPMRGAMKKALEWAQGQHIWISRQIEAAPDVVTIAPGGVIPICGRGRRICWDRSYPRTPDLLDTELRLGGPEEQVGARIGRWVRAYALAVLTRETQDIAAKEKIIIPSVRIGDPRSRWGSCAADGVIRYSWRLILAPPEVRIATVAHEVAHRLHMDHSPAFHAAHARLLGDDPAPARAWLRVHGASLHRIKI